MYSQVFGEGRGWREDRGREGEVKGKWGRVVWGSGKRERVSSADLCCLWSMKEKV